MEIEEAVIDKIKLRRAKGRDTYGVTMERTDLSKRQWLIHLQEEMLDAAIYLQKLIQIESAQETHVYTPVDEPASTQVYMDQNGRYFTEQNGERHYLNITPTK